MSIRELLISPVGGELLDDPSADAGVVAESLRNIAVANRWFGGTAAALFGLGRVLADVPRGSRITLLDIGTGHGDLPAAAVRWGRSRGLEIVPLGLERSPVAAMLASAGGVPTVLADAAAPPIRAGSVDVVLVSQVAHHFAPDSVARLARTCDGLARRGVVIADLHRSGIAAAGFWIGSRLLGFHRVTRLDGITSIRRGFSAAGLRAILTGAGLTARVERRPGYRLVASWAPRSVMRTVDRITMHAPLARVFGAASDVEQWPALLAHYRWVRLLPGGPPGGALVEMAAWRPFGALRYPTWWVSEMWVDQVASTVRYRHVRGITAGMDVEWKLVSTKEGIDVTIVHEWTGPRWPLIRRPAAEWVIGPVFIHGIASRTLAGLKSAVEASRG